MYVDFERRYIAGTFLSKETDVPIWCITWDKRRTHSTNLSRFWTTETEVLIYADFESRNDMGRRCIDLSKETVVPIYFNFERGYNICFPVVLFGQRNIYRCCVNFEGTNNISSSKKSFEQENRSTHICWPWKDQQSMLGRCQIFEPENPIMTLEVLSKEAAHKPDMASFEQREQRNQTLGLLDVFWAARETEVLIYVDFERRTQHVGWWQTFEPENRIMTFEILSRKSASHSAKHPNFEQKAEKADP